MTGSVVDMAPFWAWIAAPALAATLAAAGYLWAAWKWPPLRTPVASFRVRRLTGLRHDPGDTSASDVDDWNPDGAR